ncbi:hypothetical protein TSUD_147570 [Trifolium subterraneum]|uniref:Disease resistance protein Roq1-like winged-helix domain-containing protein n=1 Tax=Trifolium subterraneum TaxID=3900 RepID=A0A2Z6P3Y1_TRISU|nr:hypothetical protein TSUD_147570 [Trifolium subterraneum]
MKIQNVLKLSYDDLDSDQQNIFLDIACFFKEESRDRVTNLLKACGFHPGIRDPVEKSLITISNKGTIEMHDLIQEMCWNIVHQESPKGPGSRSRLWDPNEVYAVLKYNKDLAMLQRQLLISERILGHFKQTRETVVRWYIYPRIALINLVLQETEDD